MKRILFILTVITISFSACIKVDIDDSVNNTGEGGGTGSGSKQDQIISSKIITGQITEDVTLPKGRYVLKGYVYVTNRASLTLAPGTIIVSDVANKGALIVERNSKLFAAGTATEPIVFTSGQPAGQRKPGDWGGIILLGNAPTNRTTEPTIEGGVNSKYGGTIAGDNSGTLTYVRIEFAGIASDPNSEINGLTLGGVGSGTKLENIQVSFGNDDAYEFFGGTVNAKNIIAFATADDDFDFDFGFSGNIQFAVSSRKPDFVDGGDAGNGIESDNDGTGTDGSPKTKPTLSNFTIIGPGAGTIADNHNFSNRWRRASQFIIRNSILMGHPDAGFSMESAATAQAYKDGVAQFKNNLVQAGSNIYKVDAAAAAVISAADVKIKAEAEGNITFTNADDIKLTKPWYSTSPNYLPQTGSPALTGADFTGLPAFFTSTTFRGAFGTDDWTKGWTNWDPQNADYSAVK